MKTVNALPSSLSKMNQKKLFLKIGFILLLILLLMIPNVMIKGLIFERQSLEEETQREIAASWGPSQKMIGPILSIPFTIEVVGDEESKFFTQELRVLPENLNLDVSVTTKERKKSIYKAILYNAMHEIDGDFILPDKSKFGDNVTDIHWDRATIDIGFTSSASLDNIVNFKMGESSYKMESGSSNIGLLSSGIHAQVVIDPEKERYTFESVIGLNGSESLKYLPLARNTSLTMKSTWDSPGFVGLPLPQNREISQDGFVANWKATEYNRSFRDTWHNNSVQLSHQNEFFGVDLVQTVGHYQKNMRSAKYALLIISLSFLVFFFFEMLKGSRIHPVQYIFVGLSLSIFYILLLSLSEHVGFDFAYLIAGASVVGLISWYSKFLLVRSSSVIVLTIVLGGLYTYIYILLQMEEYALLVGSIGLFIALGITMYLSRNMDWYGVQNSIGPDMEENELIEA